MIPPCFIFLKVLRDFELSNIQRNNFFFIECFLYFLLTYLAQRLFFIHYYRVLVTSNSKTIKASLVVKIHSTYLMIFFFQNYLQWEQQLQSCSFEIEQGPFYAVNNHFTTQPGGCYSCCYPQFYLCFQLPPLWAFQRGM